MRPVTNLLILFGLPLAVVIWFTDNTLGIILTPFVVFLLYITYITRAKFFLLDAAYVFWVSMKLQIYFRPQLDWIRTNIGKIYITEEVVKHIWTVFILKYKRNLDLRLQSAIVSSVLVIPNDIKITLFEIWLQESRKDAYLTDVAIRESYEPKHEAKELRELMAAIHKDPHRYKIICEYDFR